MGEITLRKALDDYKTIHMPYRNFAERTRVEYLNDLEDLIRFMEKSGIHHVKQLALLIIEEYVAHLEQKGFVGLTRKRKVVAIRSFLSFLYQDGYIGTNIAGRVILPFTESSLPHFLTQAECDQIRKACADDPRDAAIIELLLQTGMKLSEITGLTLNDVELEKTQGLAEKHSGFIRLLGGRGKKERLVPLNIKASLALENYLRARMDTENNILFINRFGEPLGGRGVQKILRKHLKSAGIGRASIQTLRHTFGAHHIAKGTSLKTIQEVLGLKDARSTSIYQSLAKEVISRELQEHSL